MTTCSDQTESLTGHRTLLWVNARDRDQWRRRSKKLFSAEVLDSLVVRAFGGCLGFLLGQDAIVVGILGTDGA